MKSFTLTEIMAAVSITIIIMLGVFRVMDTGRNAWLTGQTAVELRQEIIKTFIRMDSELRATAPAQINIPNTFTLIFRLPRDLDADGTVLDSAGQIEWSAPITYSLNNGQIIRSSPAGNAVMANNITSLRFSLPSSNILQIDITAGKIAANRRQMQDSDQLKLTMRNL